jgi:hypothetical protein
MIAKLHENLDIVILMNSWSPNFDDGSKNYMGIFVMEMETWTCQFGSCILK